MVFNSAAIDAHCHPWFRSAEHKEELSDISVHNLDYLSIDQYISNLSRDRDLDSEGLVHYLEMTKLKTVLVDVGWPLNQNDRLWMKLKKFAPFWRLLRLENVWEQALIESNNLNDISDKLMSSMKDIRKNSEKFIGWKTVIAYETGLNVSESTKDNIETEFLKFRKGSKKRSSLKALNDYLFTESLKIIAEDRDTLQIHTGLGAPLAGGIMVNPSNLANIFSKISNLPKIVILHGGWPYLDEALWLTRNFENVYMETSLPFFLTYKDLKAILRRLMLSGLKSKILYGSDSVGSPINHVLSLLIREKAMSETLEELRNEKVLNSNVDLKLIADKYFVDNATEVYGKKIRGVY
jgi:predicted TIM-barrel fold metal-dependent hydrolase